MYKPKYDKDVTGISVTDEFHTSVGASAFQLDHDYFLGGLDLTIRTASGGGGTLLTSPGDYIYVEQNSSLETEVNAAIGPGKTVYKKIQVTNATYQTVDLYFSPTYIADDNSHTDAEYLKRHSNKLAISSSPYTVLETDNYSLYKVTTGGSLKIMDLPAAADTEDQVFKIRKEDSGVACVKLQPDGTDKIVASSGAELSFLLLFLKGDLVEIMSNGTDWFIINSFKPYFISGWQNRSDESNVHLGFAQVAYTGASGTFTIGEILTESVSGTTGILIHDSGTVFTLVSVISPGIFVNARTLTGNTSTETATVNGNTKNLDTNILHNWSAAEKFITTKVSVSSDGTDNNSFSVYDWMSESRGTTKFQVSSNEYKIQTGSIGMVYFSDTGGIPTAIDSSDIYINIISVM